VYINYYALIFLMTKDIKIETEEDVGLDDKIKAGAKAVGEKIEDPDKDLGTEYEKEKAKERVVD
jgi:hypothetical protein